MTGLNKVIPQRSSLTAEVKQNKQFGIASVNYIIMTEM